MFAILAPTVLATLLAGCVVDDDGVPARTDLLRVRTSVETPFVGSRAIDGATIVVDDAYGDRFELKTNEAGYAWAVVDWADGPFAVTMDSGLEGQPLVSILGVDKDEREVQWTWEEPITDDETVVVAGLVDDHDPDMTLKVYVYGAGNDTFSGSAWLGIYAVQVLPGQSFQILAMDVDEAMGDQSTWRTMSRWTEVESDGVTDNTKVDIDLGPYFDADGFPWDLDPERQLDPDWIHDNGPDVEPMSYLADEHVNTRIAPITTSGTIRMPADLDDPLRDGGQADVAITCAVDGVAQECGWATWVGWDDTRERYAFFAQHFVPTLTERVYTRITATNGDNGSMMTVNGDPSVWLTMPQLLPVPDLVASDTADVNMQHWGFILTDEQLPENTRYWVSLENKVGEDLWLIRGTGDRTIDLPEPPYTVDAADLREQVQAVRPWLTRGLGYDVTATSWSARHELRRL